MVYTIGEIIKQVDVAASTLRYYDKEGLLKKVAPCGIVREQRKTLKKGATKN